MADSKKYDGSQWEHSLRKLTTATEAVENPLYSDGTAITSYTISGNTVQNGTPTPDNPVMPQSTGESTGNLFDYQTMMGGKTHYYLDASGNEIQNNFWSITKYIPVDGTVFTLTRTIGGTAPAICLYDSNQNFITGVTYQGEQFVTISSNTNAAYIRFSYFIGEPLEDIAHDMLNSGSTPLPYEPYGYKIPISNGGVTTNIYLGSTQTVRQIRKLVLTGEETGWFLSGTNSYGIANFGLPNALESFVSNNPVCSHFVYQTTLQNDTKTEGIFINAQLSLYVRVYAADLPNKKAIVDWLKAQYADGTPVTVYYVLAAPETATVNEPLMKIGTYADTLSNAASIPTTEGANSITVDTTVQPSEFTATWTGWHDASVKEYEGGVGNNKFDEQYPDIKFDVTYRPLYVGSGAFTCTSTCPQSQYGAQLFILAGNVSSGASTNTNGVWNGAVRSVTAVDGYVTIGYRNAGGVSPSGYDTMLNAGSTALPYEPYEYGWE